MSNGPGGGASHPIPADLKEFVRDYIDSISGLELLLLLRQRASQSLTAVEISGELRSNLAHTSSQLERLRALALVERVDEQRFTFAPATPRLAELVESLARHYATHRVSMINFIYAPPGQHEIQQFSDAFKLRKE